MFGLLAPFSTQMQYGLEQSKWSQNWTHLESVAWYFQLFNRTSSWVDVFQELQHDLKRKMEQ